LIYPVVEVRGLVNRFGDQLVHDGLDMEVRAHEVFGIVGGSGAGKSVLLRTILGLRRPQAGAVRIEGLDITRLTDEQLYAVKARYGVTFQHGALFSALTVLQNVQLPMIEHLRLTPTELDRPGTRGRSQVPGAIVRRHDQACSAGACHGSRSNAPAPR